MHRKTWRVKFRDKSEDGNNGEAASAPTVTINLRAAPMKTTSEWNDRSGGTLSYPGHAKPKYFKEENLDFR